MSPLTLELVTARDYVAHLIAEVDQAKRRVTLVSLLFLTGPIMNELCAALHRALARGIQVLIVYDAFTWYYVGRGRLPISILRSTDPEREAATRHILHQLRQAGATVVQVGKMGLNPYRGRCHTKFSLVDDRVYVFGGVNLYDEAFHQVDYMWTAHRPELAAQLQTLAGFIGHHTRQPDQELKLNTASTILVDGGLPTQSIIYRRACELAGRAVRIHYVSQYCPTGPLATLLRRAHAVCYFNRPLHAPFHVSIMVLGDQWVSRIRNHYRRPIFLHAKFILFELPDGTKALISGSHNFSWHGVPYGTQEIALYSTDEALWQRLYGYLQSDIIAT